MNKIISIILYINHGILFFLGLAWNLNLCKTLNVTCSNFKYDAFQKARMNLTYQKTCFLKLIHGSLHCSYYRPQRKKTRERCCSVVECLTRNRKAAGSSLTVATALCLRARHINPSLVLVQPRKTCPYITERLLMGPKESNNLTIQSKKTIFGIFRMQQRHSPVCGYVQTD